MSAPTPYNITTDFSDEELNNVSGRDEVRTAAIDEELVNIRTAITSLITRSTAIQRDDNALLDAIVRVHTLSSDVLTLLGSAGFTIHSPLGWLTATAYVSREIVTQGTGTYVCAVAHTSGVFATDLAAGKWATIFDTATFAASNITFTPTGTIAASNVQSALAEAASEALQKSSNLSDVASATTSRSNLSVPSKAETQQLTYSTATVGGTADAITGTCVPAIANLASNFLVYIGAASANSSTTPTYAQDGLTAKTIKKYNGTALSAGDIAGSGHVIQLYWDSVNDCYLLLNPAEPQAIFTAISGQYLPRSLLPNHRFQVDQLANSATSVADDNYGHDHWYVLTQTASIQVSTQTLQSNLYSTNVRLTQNQAASQRFGYACIIESKEAQKLRGNQLSLGFVIRASTSQAIRIAVLEWTGTADSVTSDIVNDWTSSDYTDGAARFFVDANITPLGTSSITPSANVISNSGFLTVTAGSSLNNLIVFVWTEGVAAQNFTLDLFEARLTLEAYNGKLFIPTFDETLRYAMRFYEKSFPYATAPAQNAGAAEAELHMQITGAAAVNFTQAIRFTVPKRSGPTMTLYNPSAANAQARNASIAADCTVTAASGTTGINFSVNYTSAGGSAAGNTNLFHWTANSRL